MTCADGTNHNIVTPADRDRYDPEIFAAIDLTPPNVHNWGHCTKCRCPFRWSVRHQAWREYPGGVGMLPQLTSEELEVLGSAIAGQLASIDAGLELCTAPGLRTELDHRALILHSLATAVAEAQYHLWPPSDTVPAPRAVGRMGLSGNLRVFQPQAPEHLS